MGTIAARDCLRVLELTEQVAAALLLATRQALELRTRQGVPARERLAPAARACLEALAAELPAVTEDRPLDTALADLADGMRQCRWSLYP